MALPPFFYQIFEHLPREGPGCPGATRKVFSLLPPLSAAAAVLDIGCRSGAQTHVLAQLTTGTITAVDNHLPFLDSVSAWAGKEGVSGRIKTVCASMDTLPFDPGTFDLIWSEGAIFIVGFEAGGAPARRHVPAARNRVVGALSCSAARHDPFATGIMDALEHEAEMYRKYRKYYGYTFFVMQNT